MGQQLQLREAGGIWVVRCGTAEIARSSRVLELSEGDAPPVLVFPPEDVVAGAVEPQADAPPAAAGSMMGRPRPCRVTGAGVAIEGGALLIEAPRLPLRELAGWILFDRARLTVATA